MLVPSLKSTLCTCDFLTLTRNSHLLFFKYIDVKYFETAQSPSTDLIQAELVKALIAHKNRFINKKGVDLLVEQLSGKRRGDKRYLMLMLGTVCQGNHKFFSKEFVVPPKKVPDNQLMINNSNNFFSNLPPSTTKASTKITRLILTK